MVSFSLPVTLGWAGKGLNACREASPALEKESQSPKEQLAGRAWEAWEHAYWLSSASHVSLHVQVVVLFLSSKQAFTNLETVQRKMVRGETEK